MSLPNQLTVLRLLIVPFIAVALIGSFAYHDQVAVILYATAAATDSLDGWIARRRRLVTELGKFLDPLADKLLVVTVLAILVGQGTLTVWVAVVIVVREFAITGLRSVAARQGVVVASSRGGKTKTLTQNAMIELVILQRPFGILHTPALVMIGIAVAATVVTGLDYLWRYRRVVIPG